MTILPGFAALGGFAAGARSSVLSSLQIIFCISFAIAFGALMIWTIKLTGYWLARIIMRNHEAGKEISGRTAFALVLMHILALAWIPTSAILASEVAMLIIKLL